MVFLSLFARRSYRLVIAIPKYGFPNARLFYTKHAAVRRTLCSYCILFLLHYTAAERTSCCHRAGRGKVPVALWKASELFRTFPETFPKGFSDQARLGK